MWLRSLDGLRGIASAIVVRMPWQLPSSGQESSPGLLRPKRTCRRDPALGRAGFSWIGSYPLRVERLLLPVIGSVLLVAIFILLTPRDLSTAVSGWAERTFARLDRHEVLPGFDLLGGSSLINTPL